MWLFIGLPCLAIFCMFIIHAYASLDKVKSNWSEYRCNPAYMPFAGFVDSDGAGANLVHCLNQSATSVFGFVLDELHSMLKTMFSGLEEIIGPINIFRTMLTMIRKVVLSFTTTTLSKATDSTSVFVTSLIKIRDIIQRFVGQGYVASMIAYTAVSFIESFVTLCMSVIKGFIYAMLAISIVLALFQPELLAIVISMASLLAAAGA